MPHLPLVDLTHNLGPNPAKWKPLKRRQDSGKGLESSQEGGIIAAVVVVVILCLALLSYIILRRLRSRHDDPKYVPSEWLKQKWQAWTPPPVRRRYSTAWQDRRAVQEARRTPSPTSTLRALRSSQGLELSSHDLSGTLEQRDDGANDQPDRRTSVRSVMTLPAYSEDARATEKIIGREGERSGIDTVVEFPENIDEEEARRDEEMESLYQIRVARRRERAEREERRRLRSEARARGDHTTLNRLRQQARNRGNRSTSAIAGEPSNSASSTTLMQEHQSKERGRRVSSVSYAALGVARHDGSRVRANSNDSDQHPLLEGAAAMGSENANGPRPGFQTHLHNPSSSSLRFQAGDYSDDERGSSEFEFAPTPRESHSRGPSLSPARPSMSTTTISHNGDIGEERMPLPEPPRYQPNPDEPHPAPQRRRFLPQLRRLERPQSQPPEQAPPYVSPTSTGAARLSAFAPLPAIEVTPFTPILGRWDPGEEERERAENSGGREH